MSLTNCAEFIACYYAVMKVGAVVVPIGYLLTPYEEQYILDDAEPSLIITNSTKVTELYEIKGQKTALVVVDSPGIVSPEIKYFWELIKKQPDALPVCPVDKDDTCCIIYTSGTTARPKGVMLTHHNMTFNMSLLVENEEFESYGESVVRLGALPLYHIFGQSMNLLAPMMAGSMVVLLERFQVDEVLDAIKKYRPNVFCGVPTMYIQIANNYDPKKHDLSSLCYCMSSAAPLPDEARRFFQEKTGIEITNAYGISEGTGPVFLHPERQGSKKSKPASVGIALRNKYGQTEAKMVDDNGVELPVNEVGELVIKGGLVMKGYWKMPEETAKTVRDGWLYTGDLAKKDEDGYFYIIDRKKDLIIVGGRNVVPREVEEVLYQNEKVLEAAVVGIPDGVMGEVVKAVVALKNDVQASEVELIDFCQQRLARYKVPKVIEIRDELKKSATGKILRRLAK